MQRHDVITLNFFRQSGQCVTALKGDQRGRGKIKDCQSAGAGALQVF